MSDVDESANLVAVVLSPHCLPSVVALADNEAVAPSVRIGETSFVDSGAGDWLGFYDWLRSPQGKVIGIQQWIDEFSIFSLLKLYQGVEYDLVHSVVRIFFGQAREVDEQHSCDQDFGSNRLLIAGDSVALTFNTPYR